MDNLIKKYFWLITTIRTFGPLSFEQINGYWRRSRLNYYNEDLSKKTFRNWIEAIAESLDIEIVCERKGGYKYSVREETTRDHWMSNYLDTLSVQSAIEEDAALKDRIIDFDRRYHPLLPQLAQYIKLRSAIKFRIFISFAEERKNPETAHYKDVDFSYGNYYPLGLLQTSRYWYVVGIFLSKKGAPWHKTIAAYRLEDMTDVSEQGGEPAPDYPEGFSLRNYIKSITVPDTARMFTQTVLLYSDLDYCHALEEN